MPKTPKRVRTAVTAANLERLGAPQLAALLADHARRDRALRETLARILAEAAGEDELRDYIDRRLLSLAKGRPLDREGARTLARELDGLRHSAIDVIARRNTEAAAGLLRHMIDRGPAIGRRAPPPRDPMQAWQAAVLADLARLWTGSPPPDPGDVEALAFVLCTRDDDPIPESTSILSPVLGKAGLSRLGARLRAELKQLPAEPVGGRWGAAGGPAYRTGMHARRLRQRLGEIADLLGDVDAFIALERAQPRPQVNVRAIVERLLKARRGAEALAWLDDARYHNRLIPTLDLRLATLEALDRGDEAQALRWQRFEQQLDREMLRDYLKRLPDFEDFEAERRAMGHVLAHKSVSDALAFLLAWPALDSIAALVRERSSEFGATPPDMLLATGEALRPLHPQEAVVAVRAAVLGILRRGLTFLFEKAARALAECAALEPPGWSGSDQESHDAFVDRLRELFPRQWSFWRLYDAVRI